MKPKPKNAKTLKCTLRPLVDADGTWKAELYAWRHVIEPIVSAGKGKRQKRRGRGGKGKGRRGGKGRASDTEENLAMHERRCGGDTLRREMTDDIQCWCASLMPGGWTPRTRGCVVMWLMQCGVKFTVNCPFTFLKIAQTIPHQGNKWQQQNQITVVEWLCSPF